MVGLQIPLFIKHLFSLPQTRLELVLEVSLNVRSEETLLSQDADSNCSWQVGSLVACSATTS